MSDRELLALALGVLTHSRYMMRLADGPMGLVFAKGDIDNLTQHLGQHLGVKVLEETGEPAGRPLR